MASTKNNSIHTAPVVTITLNPAFDLILQVENFQLGKHQLAQLLESLPAGKGLNVSRTLSTLGLSSIITGFIGRDNRLQFRQALGDYMITGQLFTVPGRTRQNITIIDPINQTDTHIRQRGLEVTKRDLRKLGKKLSLLADNNRLFVFAGSLPPGATAKDLARLIRICRQGGARVAVDTSGQPLKAAVDEGLWLIKPNRQEFAQLTEQADQTTEQIIISARKLTDRVENILISLGKHGALLVNRQAALKAALDTKESTPAVNTVGSGDSLLGAFLAGVLQGLDLPDCLAKAVAVSTAACRTPIPASFDPQTARQIHAQITTEQLF